MKGVALNNAMNKGDAMNKNDAMSSNGATNLHDAMSLDDAITNAAAVLRAGGADAHRLRKRCRACGVPIGARNHWAAHAEFGYRAISYPRGRHAAGNNVGEHFRRTGPFS